MKRGTAVLLTAALTLSVLPGSSILQTAQPAQAAGYGISNPTTDSDGVTTWDCVYFGNYYQSSETAKEPIKWRVLSVNGDDAFLLADQNLDGKPYNETYTSVTWETCTLRSWLNGYGAGSNVDGKDYSGDNFLDAAFSQTEQSAIRTTSVINEDNPTYGTEGGNTTQDKIYLLSIAEASNASYGFQATFDTESETRVATNTAHTASYSYMNSTGNTDWWCLRSPGHFANHASSVSYGGSGSYNGWDVNDYINAVRPALHLNLSSDLWRGAGQVTSAGGGGGETTPPAGETNPPAGESDGWLECSPDSTVEDGSMEWFPAIAYGNGAWDYDTMRSFTNGIRWSSSDSGIAVLSGGFLMPTAPDTYTNGTEKLSRWRVTGMFCLTGVSPGEAVITATLPDGSTVQTAVTVTAKQDSSGEEGNAGSFSFSDAAEGETDGDAVKFFPQTWSVKHCAFPVNISQTEEENGNTKVKVSVGLGRSDILDSETQWSKYKKNVSDAEKYTGKVNTLQELTEAWGAKSGYFCETKGIKAKPQISAMGYVEVVCDKNGNMISSEGKIAMDGKWGASASWQFVTPIGPLYINLSGEGKLSAKIGPKYNVDTGEVQWGDGSVSFTPSLTLEGGYGIDKVASIGAQGKAELPVGIYPDFTGKFQASAGIHVQLLFFLDETYTLASYRKQLWSKKKSLSPVRGKQAVSPVDLTAGRWSGLSEMDTSFAEQTTRWNGETGEDFQASADRLAGRKGNGRTISDSTLLAQAQDAENGLTRVIQDGILPSTLPMQAAIGDKRVMVFQGYDDSYSTLNSVRLLYSVYDQGVWSEPKTITKEGGSDTYADLRMVGGRLVLAWQKENTTISGDVAEDADGVLSDLAKHAEICVSVFEEEQGTFTAPVYLTRNSDCDMMPRICGETDDITVAWLRNDAGDFMQESGKNSIYTVEVDADALLADGTQTGEETFSAEKLLGELPGSVSDYVVYQGKDGVHAFCSGTADGMTAVFDEHGNVIPSLEETMQLAEQGAPSGLQMADGMIYVVVNGTLYSYEISSGQVQGNLAGETVFGSNIEYCSNGEKAGFLWSIYNEESGTGRVMASLRTAEGYSDPIVLAEESGKIWRNLSPVMDGDGNWSILANAERVDDGIHSLCMIEKMQGSRMELAGASVDPADTMDGRTAVEYYAVNTQDSTIYQLEITVTLADGTVIRKTVDTEIAPGESVAGKVYLDFSAVQDAQQMTVSVAAKDQVAIEDCTVTTDVGQADVSVVGTGRETAEDVEVTATLSNDSQVSANISLSLYSEAEKLHCREKQDDIELKAGEKKQITFTVPKKELAYNENDAIYMTLDAQVGGGDYRMDNNTAFVVFYRSSPENTQKPALPSEQPTAEPSQNPSVLPSSQPPVSSGGETSGASGNAAGGNATAVTPPSNNRSAKKPGKVTGLKLRRQKRSVFVSWTWKSGVSGFQIQYARNKKFTKQKKTQKAGKYTNDKTIRGLKREKTYYFRVRAYKTSNGKKLYGKWSKVKKVKVK